MKNLPWAALLALSFWLISTNDLQAAEDQPIKTTMRVSDFTDKDTALNWFIQNDTVMGGRSSGRFMVENEQLVFTGRTDTNGGGFSSVRSGALRLDLSRYDGIRLNVKADGRRYTWHIQTDATWNGRRISYWADFNTENGKWIMVDIPFSNFIPRFRGSILDGPPLNLANIKELGLYIYDKQDGDFMLQLDSVLAYSLP